MDINDYVITKLDHIAYDMYCDHDENEPYNGEYHNFFDFLLEHDDYLEYYEKAIRKIRKDKLIEIENTHNDSN